MTTTEIARISSVLVNMSNTNIKSLIHQPRIQLADRPRVQLKPLGSLEYFGDHGANFRQIGEFAGRDPAHGDPRVGFVVDRHEVAAILHHLAPGGTGDLGALRDHCSPLATFRSLSIFLLRAALRRS